MGSLSKPGRITAVVWTLIHVAGQQGTAAEPGHVRTLHRDSSQDDSKWVVITTVSLPTETVKALAAVPDWRLVVVADQNTPKDWALDGALAGVDFLDLEKQKSLGYSIIPLLPDNHYARKNLGYLWAIEHGATQILDIEDDVQIKEAGLPDLASMEHYVFNTSGDMAEDAAMCNPYAFYGQPQLWPRGYPLDRILNEPECKAFSRGPAQPLILQGLIDVHPDVDAICRMTQPLGASFDEHLPSVVLPRGTMVPCSAQNTLFLQGAFWGLLLPVSVSQRVSDIWRGYWVQRVLWEVGGNLAFGPPTVSRHTNRTQVLADRLEEAALYDRGGDLVRALSEWAPDEGIDLPQLLAAAAELLTERHLWKERDAELMNAWLKDLETLGYRFPRRHAQHLGTPAFSLEVPDQAATPSAEAAGGPTAAPAPAAAPERHRTPRSWLRYDNIALVVFFNGRYKGWLATHAALQEAYAPLFAAMIWTGWVGRPWELAAHEAWVDCESDNGGFNYMCLTNVMQEVVAPPDGGFLFVGDDVLLSHCQIAAFDPSKVWFQRAVVPKQESLAAFVDEMAEKGNTQTWAYTHASIDAMHRVFERFRSGVGRNRFGARVAEKLGDDLNQAHFGGDNTDVFYIPASMAADYRVAASAFAAEGVCAELAVPAIMGLITDSANDFQVFKPLYYWGEARDKLMREPSRVLRQGLAGHAFMMHPYKLSGPGARSQFWHWWLNTSCHESPQFDADWTGTVGVGVGPNGIVDQDSKHEYINLHLD